MQFRKAFVVLLVSLFSASIYAEEDGSHFELGPFSENQSGRAKILLNKIRYRHRSDLSTNGEFFAYQKKSKRTQKYLYIFSRSGDFRVLKFRRDLTLYLIDDSGRLVIRENNKRQLISHSKEVLKEYIFTDGFVEALLFDDSLLISQSRILSHAWIIGRLLIDNGSEAREIYGSNQLVQAEQIGNIFTDASKSNVYFVTDSNWYSREPFYKFYKYNLDTGLIKLDKLSLSSSEPGYASELDYNYPIAIFSSGKVLTVLNKTFNLVDSSTGDSELFAKYDSTSEECDKTGRKTCSFAYITNKQLLEFYPELLTSSLDLSHYKFSSFTSTLSEDGTVVIKLSNGNRIKLIRASLVASTGTSLN